ncbi:PTS sugar transporter subunit IIB [Oceanotoga sp. DSM 15011]|jgi:PTS system galactitol-specific IIB component|uniref:PTS system IIB component (Gat family) n=1 Tax=Oceanotoga teriensis TaxID=515440 RepID=A0AA45C7E1_9BACT|nr:MULTISPECIES: PTS sugar transporter subunit IIB [Oceanotoga]MDN5342684.1 galactitol system component [Oceanotoga sp.]MDO7976764.1 PTS sugar transporter subunit IIB [Oceanotoga teriensis]PWJ95274.1 PTS system IIB component (Gat family) [Oceanotoga teriensis]UYP00603.1 PTS sugar transporter subunit IIB [Oceanotoga sp. DSM 15011]
MKKIVVACGSGVATSQTIASKIDSMLQDEGIKASVEAVDIKSLDNIIDQVDVYVKIVSGPTNYDIPTINGIPFLTGMGRDAEFEKLKEYLK